MLRRVSKLVKPQECRKLLSVRKFSERVYGNLADEDRIFTNLYADEDVYIDGALKRVT